MDEVERVVLNALANNAVLSPDKSCVFGEADPPAFGFRHSYSLNIRAIRLARRSLGEGGWSSAPSN